MKARVRKKTEEVAGKKRFLISEIQAEMMPH
jgi:hypothetical protein